MEQERHIAQAELRLAAVGRGSCVLSDGSDPDWAFRTEQSLAVDLARVRGELAAAREEADLTTRAELDLFAELSDGAVHAPPDSLIRSMIVGAGATVDAGAAAARGWIAASCWSMCRCRTSRSLYCTTLRKPTSFSRASLGLGGAR